VSRPALLPALVLAAIVAQVAVPAWVLLDGKQNRWGWQMYAGREEVISVTALDDRGREVEVGPYVARSRPEIRWDKHAPPYLCALPDVQQVVIEWSDDSEVVVECS
jgi:hypothetical protein